MQTLIWVYQDKFHTRLSSRGALMGIGMVQATVTTEKDVQNLQEKFFYQHPLKIPPQYEIKRQQSYLLGRIAASKSITALEITPTKIYFAQGLLGNPLTYLTNKTQVQISLTHDQDLGLCISTFENVNLGVDFCWDHPNRQKMFARVISEEETRLLTPPPPKSLFWCAKEALRKALQLGRHIWGSLLRICAIKPLNKTAYEIEYENFPKWIGIFIQHRGKNLCFVLLKDWIQGTQHNMATWGQHTLEQIPSTQIDFIQQSLSSS